MRRGERKKQKCCCSRKLLGVVHALSPPPPACRSAVNRRFWIEPLLANESPQMGKSNGLERKTTWYEKRKAKRKKTFKKTVAHIIFAVPLWFLFRKETCLFKYPGMGLKVFGTLHWFLYSPEQEWEKAIKTPSLKPRKFFHRCSQPPCGLLPGKKFDSAKLKGFQAKWNKHNTIFVWESKEG